MPISVQRIKAGVAHVHNYARPRDLTPTLGLREVIGNDHVIDPVENLGDDLNAGPERVELSASHEVGGLVPVPDATEPSLLRLQSDLDLAHSARESDIAHEHTSPLTAGQEPQSPGVRASTLEGRAAATSPRAAAAPGSLNTSPAPYFQDGTVTLYHGDCLELLDVWADAAVLVTDPPYGLEGLAGAYGTTHRTIANDKDTSFRDRVLELWGDRPAAIFGSPRLQEPPGAWSDRLVWDKGQLGMNGGAWRYAHESIFVRGDGWQRLNDKASSILRYTTQANRANVRDHIHSKPVPLIAQLIASAPPGLVVDPFGGGGATAVACALLGRPVVIIELEQEFCDVIVRRLQQQTFDFGAIE